MTVEKSRIVLIPAYMPDERLIGLTNELVKKGFSLVVVNDGSSYDKMDLFGKIKNKGTVLTYDVNRGKGAAIKTGLRYIKKEYGKDCIVITADSDGQHSPEDINRVYLKSKEFENTLVIGSRKMDRNVPFRSRMGNRITRVIFRIKTHHRVYDTQTGLRAFSGKLLDEFINIEGDRYEYEMNVLLHCIKNNISIEEIPVNTLYFNGNSTSHFDTVKDSVRIYKKLFKY